MIPEFPITHKGKPHIVRLEIIAASVTHGKDDPESEQDLEERREFLEVITKAVKDSIPLVEGEIREAVK